jgi:precorrin-2/cobalt-factor-2 C20-methyltransferase
MSGFFYGVGVGPGDPDLITVKAAKVLATIDVVAYFAKTGHSGHARRVAEAHVPAGRDWLRLEYPFTTEISYDDPRYASGGSACRAA